MVPHEVCSAALVHGVVCWMTGAHVYSVVCWLFGCSLVAWFVGGFICAIVFVVPGDAGPFKFKL